MPSCGPVSVVYLWSSLMGYVEAALTVEEDCKGGNCGQPKCPKIFCLKMDIVHIKSGTFSKILFGVFPDV